MSTPKIKHTHFIPFYSSHDVEIPYYTMRHHGFAWVSMANYGCHLGASTTGLELFFNGFSVAGIQPFVNYHWAPAGNGRDIQHDD